MLLNTMFVEYNGTIKYNTIHFFKTTKKDNNYNVWKRLFKESMTKTNI